MATSGGQRGGARSRRPPSPADTRPPTRYAYWRSPSRPRGGLLIAATVEAFVAAAESGEARLEVVDVPNGHHSFDIVDDTDESRQAIRRAVDRVLSLLR